MNSEAFEIINPGLSATLQDCGRVGWRRFGVPPSGVMDDHAAAWANRLLDNPHDAPVLELLLHGTILSAKLDVWIAITGADMETAHPRWRAVRVRNGETIQFQRQHKGVWTYIAVEGGFDAPRWLGSASVYARGAIGRALARGDVLRRRTDRNFQLPEHVAGRVAPWSEQRNYSAPPQFRVWPGPQWDLFSQSEREKFFAQNWTVASQSDRVGYRLSAEPLTSVREQIISEPVRVGTIQVPENGQPIVTLRDGPTVGGYPKLGVIAAADISWFVQCCPGQTIRFEPANEHD